MKDPDTNLPGAVRSNSDEVLTCDTSHTEGEADAPISRSSWPPFNLTCPLPMSVEPVMFLSMFSMVLQMPLSTQYLWDRISEDVGFNSSKSSECSNSSGPIDPLQKEVETLTAHWSLYINLVTISAVLFVVPLLVSWSDVAGRRTVLILPNLGLAIQGGIYLVVMYLKLPVFYFLVAKLISGLTGDFNAILAGCFSYVADISERKSLTFRVAILEVCLGISGMLASIIGGQWVQVQGYINPFWLAVASNLASALYAYLFIRESVPKDPRAKILSYRHYKAVWHLLSTGGRSSEEDARFHRCKLWLYLLCFFVVFTVHIGSIDLSVLYELSSPLCWGPTLIGYGIAAIYLAFLTSLIGLMIMQRFLEDSWVALVGFASGIMRLVVFSVADTTALMFTGYGLGFLSMTPTPVIRSKLSKLVDPSEQGALFALVSCLESLTMLAGSSLFKSLYPATLTFMKGFTFLFAAFMLLIPTGIIGTLECLDQRRTTETPQHPDLKRHSSRSMR